MGLFRGAAHRSCEDVAEGLSGTAAASVSRLGLCGLRQLNLDDSIPVPLLELVHEVEPPAGVDSVGVDMETAVDTPTIAVAHGGSLH